MEPAETGAHIGRSAAENKRHRNPTLDGEITASRFTADRHLKDLPARQRDAFARCHHSRRPIARRKARSGAGERDPHRIGSDFEDRPAKQDFQPRHSRAIADERIGEPQAEPVQGARNRDTDVLAADPAEILHCRVQTWSQHLQTGAHSMIGSLST